VRSSFDQDFLAWLRSAPEVDEEANLARAVALAERIPTREFNEYFPLPRQKAEPRAFKVRRMAWFLRHIAALNCWARERTGA